MKAINFNFGAETEAYHACTVVLKGQTLVLGGKTQPNQVSKLFFSKFSTSIIVEQN